MNGPRLTHIGSAGEAHMVDVGDKAETVRVAVAEGFVRMQSQTLALILEGNEMEALTAVSIACLTIYDMAKAADRDMEIGGIRLVSKSGGRSGDYRRDGDQG